ncbi:MAG: sulfatase [Pseudomonadales bacterium]|jgi:uncharacterized sulfatase|nr:sulfatase [Pseudomonadales bacterium]MDP6473218.1 sulfatase [Pseudomonadales bacterium]MDP6826021.1 sulfatase [Pseudomonadales bacterium]MDP6970749.1 sulfatase [Pseudomonadales bacterium]|tara:strand:+ start:101 stop:1588 length:1488 start_codon:yes stop_codon:yes gene_type:complete
MRALALFAAATLLTSCQLQQSAALGTTGQRQPNIVILFADDLGYGDLGSYGHPNIRTPNIDQLAREGQRWTDFYVAAPVCSPSRGALLTGKLPVRTGLYGQRIRVMFPGEELGIPEPETTLAEALGAEGYRSAIIGKWHLGDAPGAYPTRHGFDYWYGLPYSNDMDWADSTSFDELLAMRARGGAEAIAGVMAARSGRYAEPKVEYWNVPLLESSGSGERVVERPAHQPTLTRRYTEQAVAFVQRNADRPFLLYMPYTMPHTPIFASSDFQGRSLGKRYGDVIEEIDWSVGQVRAALERAGVAEHTLVIFTSDNGPWLSMRHHGGSAGLLNNGKGTTFEGGMRVPAVFWWPGTITPEVVSGIGSTMDLFATSLSLAGAQPVSGIDGLDLTSVLKGTGESPRSEIAYYRAGELQALRRGDFKVQLVAEGAYGLPPERQVLETPRLYDLREDPGERHDVAARHPERMEEMLDAVARHRARTRIASPLFDARLARFAR